MENKGYISKKKKGDSLYEELHQEVLELLQKLSGDVWTDYNEHDPGVTLLENISYAITELAYKTKLPVADILQSSKQSTLTSGDNGLFIASEILTTNPVTFKDYRKIWIDQIQNIKNVWIYPVDNYEKELNNIKGLLHVYVEKYQYHTHPELEQKENDEIKTQIKQIYEQHRNLCEGLYDIEVYKPLALVIELRIVLSDTVDGEEVLANILHQVNDYLAPEVSYYSLSQLQQEEISVNDIFNGPYLANGFIREENLKDPLEIIEISKIIKIISKISGVININNFSLSYINPKTQQPHVIRDRFRIPKNMTARVLFPTSNEKLVFQNSDVTFYPDLAQTKKQLSFIQALVASKFKAASNSSNTILIPKGVLQDINYYYPIRKQLPEIYGVGDRGISGNATPLRQAQVKQLQAYLLPFDQLIINFLAQLSNIYTLFDIHGNQHATYFTNSIPDVKELLSLVQPPDTNLSIEETERYWEMVTNDLNTFFDNNASERLNKVADQLLARYAEAFQTYSLIKINNTSYGNLVPEERFKKHLLASKQQLIRDYGAISYHRSKAADYDNFPSENEILLKQPLTGVFKKIAILTGIQDLQIGTFTKAIEASGITIHSQNEEIDIIVQEIEIDTPEEHIEIEEINYVIKDETTEDRLYETMHYAGDEDNLLNDVLKYGLLESSYSIVKAASPKDAYENQDKEPQEEDEETSAYETSTEDAKSDATALNEEETQTDENTQKSVTDEILEDEQAFDEILNELKEELDEDVETEKDVIDEILEDEETFEEILEELKEELQEEEDSIEQYYVLHKKGTKKSNIVHIADTKEDAQKAIDLAINYLLTVNQQSEGFLVLEHILLLPDYLDSAFGFEIDFSLLNDSLSVVLTHYHKIHFARRDEILDTLALDLTTDELRYDTLTEATGFRLAIRAVDGEILAVSKNTYKTANEVQAIITALQQIASNTTKETIEEIAKCYVFYGTHPVDEQFFSFQMSFVLPSWPVRFQNKNFKRVFENTVYEEIPVHVVSNLHWLSFREMQNFESLYFKWLELFQLETPDYSEKERLHFYAYELVLLLQRLHCE